MSLRIPRNRRLALATAVLGAVIGFTPVQAAVADEPMPALTVGSPDPAVYGPPVPLDVTVTSPSAKDAYIKLTADPNLHFTDDAGTPLPVTHTENQGDVLTIGADDSDGNGIPGAPLPVGTIHLRVSATAPIGFGFITAQIIDGATDKGISYQASGEYSVIQGQMYGQYQAGYNLWAPTATGIPLATGASYPLTQDEDTQYPYNLPDVTHLRLLFTAQQLTAVGYTAHQIASALRIQYSPNSNIPTPTYGATTWAVGDDGSAWIDFPTHNWQNSTTRDLHEGLRIWAAWGLPAGKLTGHLQLLGSDRRLYGSDTEPLNITADARPAALQAAFYARDEAGELWQYRGETYISSSAYYYSRRAIGAGWNTYTALTPLSSFKNNGTGDMAGRDKDGVLWYYTGTGNPSAPFAPRARVGGGWNTYNLLTGAGDLTGDGHPDLLARDTTGRLWLYQGTGSTTTPYKPRIEIGPGWQHYTHITGIGDLLVNGHTDLLATDTNGTLWYYQGTDNPAAPYKPRLNIGTGWANYNALL